MSKDYLEEKTTRKTNQLTFLAHVLALPERTQAKTLLALWPEKLPKAVRSRLPKKLLQAWRGARAEKVEARGELFFNMVKENNDFLMERHGEKSMDICSLVESVPSLHAVIVSPEGEEQHMYPPPKNDHVSSDLFLAFCLALEVGGSVVLRQMSPLRVQVKNDKGQLEWVNQERVYGLVCHEGDFVPLSAAQMRQGCSVDHDGNPLVRDPKIVFGDMKATARAFYLKEKTKSLI